MTDEQLAAHLRNVVARFGPLVSENLIDFSEAADAIDRLVFSHIKNEKTAWRISEWAHNELSVSVSRPALAAALAIRAAIGPLMVARKPRADIVIAAYRAANGRIDTRATEAIIAQEIAAHLARVKKGSRNVG